MFGHSLKRAIEFPINAIKTVNSINNYSKELFMSDQLLVDNK
jgi:hypothetical protein